jgi:hypothetical protein
MVTRESPTMAVRAHLHPLAWSRRDGQLHGLGFGRPRDAAGRDIDSLSCRRWAKVYHRTPSHIPSLSLFVIVTPCDV